MMESINIYRLHKGLDICLPTQIQDILSNENTIDLTDFDCPKQPLSRWNAIRQHLDAMMCSFNVIAMKRIITYSMIVDIIIKPLGLGGYLQLFIIYDYIITCV